MNNSFRKDGHCLLDFTHFYAAVFRNQVLDFIHDFWCGSWFCWRTKQGSSLLFVRPGLNLETPKLAVENEGDKLQKQHSTWTQSPPQFFPPIKNKMLTAHISSLFIIENIRGCSTTVLVKGRLFVDIIMTLYMTFIYQYDFFVWNEKYHAIQYNTFVVISHEKVSYDPFVPGYEPPSKSALHVET